MNPVLHSKVLGEGKPLLILHGLFGMGDNWLSLGRRFAQHFQVHLVDMRNHGRSFHDDLMHYELMAEDIAEYIDYHQLEKVHVIGHSMGGKAVMWLSVLHPELLCKIVVVDIAPRAYPQKHLDIFKALNTVDFAQQTTREAVEDVLSHSLKEQKLLQFMLKNVYRTSENIKENSPNPLAFRFNLPVLEERYTMIMEPLMSQSQYEGPVLFLKGELSDYIEEDDTALIQAHFPKAIIKMVPNASHWIHADNPDFLFDTCLSFLEEKSRKE